MLQFGIGSASQETSKADALQEVCLALSAREIHSPRLFSLTWSQKTEIHRTKEEPETVPGSNKKHKTQV